VLERTEGRVDLLFTDLVMPGGINGLVLAERARERFPGLRVLLATGYNEDLAGGLRQDAEVLGKPYRQTDLADRVRATLNRPGARPAAEPPHEG
jgi:DNA-binding LytR/AlgR family response regulator